MHGARTGGGQSAHGRGRRVAWRLSGVTEAVQCADGGWTRRESEPGSVLDHLESATDAALRLSLTRSPSGAPRASSCRLRRFPRFYEHEDTPPQGGRRNGKGSRTERK